MSSIVSVTTTGSVLQLAHRDTLTRMWLSPDTGTGKPPTPVTEMIVGDMSKPILLAKASDTRLHVAPVSQTPRVDHSLDDSTWSRGLVQHWILVREDDKATLATLETPQLDRSAE